MVEISNGGRMTVPREEIEDFRLFLRTCARMSLYNAFDQDWFNKVIPGARRLIGCDQGNAAHMEGDAAVHTCLVFENLIEVSRVRLGREPDEIEKLAVILHDLKKPDHRVQAPDGSVMFPGHEEAAAKMVPRVADKLELSEEESQKLLFLVAHHGEIHQWLKLSAARRAELRTSPWILSLAVMQEADAISCILPGGGTLPVLWESIRPRF